MSSTSTISSSSSDESETSRSSSTHSESTYASQSQHEKLIPTTQQLPTQDRFVIETLKWTLDIPIGLGLCPWAIKSYHRSLLKIVTCHGITPYNVAQTIEGEIPPLTSCSDEERVALRTTLVVCPHVAEWKENFACFDEFVKSGIEQHLPQATMNADTFHCVTLVAFHPRFDKWHALPENVGVGSAIRSHWVDRGQKSVETAEAVIVEMGNQAFGMRKIKVRFVEDCRERRREQYVPIDWIVVPPRPQPGDECGSCPHELRPLPDNIMYRSPYPTIHIIDNRDLAKLCVADVSRVKRLNARRMMKLGWEGLEKHLDNIKCDDKGSL